MDFIAQHKEKISGVLRGFDRMRFRGTLRRISSADGLLSLMKYLGVLLKDFKPWVDDLTQGVRAEGEGSALFEGRPNLYLDNPGVRKEDLVRAIAERDRITQGPICTLRAVEPCSSFDIQRRDGKLHLVSRPRKCLHIYHYQYHPVVGFMHTRVQTWLPFNVHICMNGREWLRQQLDDKEIEYIKRDNCFTFVADEKKAQQLADRQLKTDWPKLFNKLIKDLYPSQHKIFPNYPIPYYWSLDESEWATDLLFNSEEVLTPLYERLLRYGMTTIGSRDVLRFLGQKVPATGGINSRFKGEVTTDLKHRPEGIRIKHRVKKNFLKMYNKQGSVLRVETTINHTRDYKVYRRAENAKPNDPCTWQKLRKGVADLPRRAQISNACNERYLQSLAAVSSAPLFGDLADAVSRPTRLNKQRVRGLNLFRADDLSLLHAIASGDFSLNGFRNRDLCAALFGARGDKKQSASVTRRLRILRGHGIISKVSHTHLYRMTAKGSQLCAALRAAELANTEKLLAIAA